MQEVYCRAAESVRTYALSTKLGHRRERSRDAIALFYVRLIRISNPCTVVTLRKSYSFDFSCFRLTSVASVWLSLLAAAVLSPVGLLFLFLRSLLTLVSFLNKKESTKLLSEIWIFLLCLQFKQIYLLVSPLTYIEDNSIRSYREFNRAQCQPTE